jgi:RND family efflux transporter MFP subunit
MKTLKKIGNYALVIAILALIGWRLFANKKHFEREFSLTRTEELIIPVVAVPVKEETLSHSFSAPGVFKPFNNVIIVAETQGQISVLNCKTGDAVMKGKILAKVDNKIVCEQFNIAKQNFEKAKKDLERYQALAKKEAISTAKIEEIELAVKNAESNYITMLENFENTEISTPITGFISGNYTDIGSCIAPGTPLFEITNINQLKVCTQLTGEQIKKVKKGMEVEIYCDAFPDKIFPGFIYSKNIKSDNSGRFEVIVNMENDKDNRVLAGMTGSVRFASIPESHLAIPRQAVYGSLKSPSVFIVKNNIAILQDVKIKANSSGMLEVLEGLDHNHTVVVNGHINLQDSTRVRLLTSKTY